MASSSSPPEPTLFARTFRELRARRRIPTRQFQKETGVSTSYIYDVERRNVIPGLERAEQLAKVFRKVAVEQEAADPDKDVRELLRARQRTILTERLDYPPFFADLIIAVQEDLQLGRPVAAFGKLDDEQRAALVEPMADAIELFALLKREQRSGLARTIERTRRVVAGAADDEERRQVIVKLVTNLDDILDAVEAGDVGDGVSAKLAELPDGERA
jgi:transcriptional regulator with XRE-family HTH domain